MQAFMNSVTSEMIMSKSNFILDRLEKMKKYVQQEHNEIVKRIHQQANYVLRMRKTKFNSDLYNQVSQSFTLFKISCQNILNTYFPLLLDPGFLALQSQQQLIDKITTLKTIVERNGNTLIKKLTKVKDEPQKQKKIRKSNRRKGKNCKIPIESTSIMQKWLLENFKDPYPSQSKKVQMARNSKLTVAQVNNWFINARQRVIKKFLKKDPKQYQRPLRESISDSE